VYGVVIFLLCLCWTENNGAEYVVVSRDGSISMSWPWMILSAGYIVIAPVSSYPISAVIAGMNMTQKLAYVKHEYPSTKSTNLHIYVTFVRDKESDMSPLLPLFHYSESRPHSKVEDVRNNKQDWMAVISHSEGIRHLMIPINSRIMNGLRVLRLIVAVMSIDTPLWTILWTTCRYGYFCQKADF
jgi:hypothetical protein